MGLILKHRRTRVIPDHEKYLNLSTRKKNGRFVDTPVWFAWERETSNYYMFSMKNGKKAGKVKRIRNFPDVKVATCTFSGQLKGDWTNARAELIDDLQQIEFAYALLRKKYGMSFRIGNIFSRLVGNYRRRQIIKVDVTEHVFVEST